MSERIVEGLAGLVAAMSNAHLAVLDAVGELERSGLWRGDGAVSVAQWLVTRHGVSHGTAAEWVRVASVLELPELRAGYASGGLSWDQLRTATRYATPETDGEVANEARWVSVRTLQRRLRDHTDASIEDLEAAHRSRYLKWWFDEERHTFRLEARLAEDDGVIVATALGRITGATPRDPETGVYERYDARAADALTQLASQSLGADTDPDRVQVVVHVAAGDLAGDTGSGETENGPALPTETVRRWACDSRLQPVLEDDTGIAVGIGRTARTIPPWLARQLRHRDGGCRFPGCERTRYTHSHRLIHEGAWQTQGDPNAELRWHHPNGTRFTPKDIYWDRPTEHPDTGHIPYWLWPTTTRPTADTS